MSAAEARNADVVLIDTAGRLHTKFNLMEELGKIRRVIERKLPEGPDEVMLVLDATTGQNALVQAKAFAEVVPITALCLTKLDGTSKGGIVFAVADQLEIPVRDRRVEPVRDYLVERVFAMTTPDALTRAARGGNVRIDLCGGSFQLDQGQKRSLDFFLQRMSSMLPPGATTTPTEPAGPPAADIEADPSAGQSWGPPDGSDSGATPPPAPVP